MNPPIECFKIDADELENYLKQLPEEFQKNTESNIDIERYANLKDEIIIDGLKKLYDLVNSNVSLSIDDLKRQCASELLKDLELRSKQKLDYRYSRNRPPNSDIPVFKKSFDPYQKSDEFNKFLKYYARSDSSHGMYTIETVSAEMLIALESATTTSEIKDKLYNSLQSYQSFAQEQTTKDLNRATIILKDQSGTTQIIIQDELKELQSITGEQKHFITSCWHHTAFVMGGF